jgi:hypothetical protein
VLVASVLGSSLAGVVVGAVATAGGGFLSSRALERDKQADAFRTLTNERLFAAAGAFAQTARDLWHLAWEPSDERGAGLDRAPALAEQHQTLRSQYAQIRLVGAGDVQNEARWVLREAYAARKVALGEPDPRPHPEGIDARRRLNLRLIAFLTAVRVQLETPGADEVPELDLAGE